MIEIGKQYQTRDGRPARVLCVDGPDTMYPVIAVVEGDDGAWNPDDFTPTGLNYFGNESPDDLIEITPEHTRWYVVSEHTGYATQEGAQAAARECYSECRVAVASITFREGDGL